MAKCNTKCKTLCSTLCNYAFILLVVFGAYLLEAGAVHVSGEGLDWLFNWQIAMILWWHESQMTKKKIEGLENGQTK
jgi:hypothetical protein